MGGRAARRGTRIGGSRPEDVPGPSGCHGVVLAHRKLLTEARTRAWCSTLREWPTARVTPERTWVANEKP